MQVWTSRFTPRTWQAEALTAWKSRGCRGIVSVVTGAGKTAFAHFCISEFVRSSAEFRILVVVPTVVLLDQWYDSLADDLGVPSCDIACLSAADPDTSVRPINLIIINTARRVAPRVARHPNTFLIVDECHRAGSPENARALAGQHAATLGLSATPQREYDDGFDKHIRPALGSIIYEYDYRKALADGIISSFDLVNVRVSLLPDERAEYRRLTQAIIRTHRAVSDKKILDRRLRVLLQRRSQVSALATVRVPVAARLALRHQGVKTILFHERVSVADQLVTNLRYHGAAATSYHSGLSPATRRDNIRLFRRGAFEVLVACRALDEGLNLPDTEVAIIASASASRRQRIQRLGRVLRPAAGKDAATIYSLFATRVERNRLLKEAATLKGVASVTWSQARVSPGAIDDASDVFINRPAAAEQLIK